MRLMRRRIMQAKACAHQRAKSCEATLCSFKICLSEKVNSARKLKFHTED